LVSVAQRDNEYGARPQQLSELRLASVGQYEGAVDGGQMLTLLTATKDIDIGEAAVLAKLVLLR
jgi:hypothetical protein